MKNLFTLLFCLFALNIFSCENHELYETNDSVKVYVALENLVFDSNSIYLIENDEINGEYVASFLAGMKLSDESKEPEITKKYFSYQRHKHFHHIKDNLDTSDNYFALLSKDESMSCLFPSRLYYRTTKLGEEKKEGKIQDKGEDTSNRVSDTIKSLTEVVVNYTMTFPDGELIVDTFLRGYPQRINMQDTIPGFALGLKGMRIGEEREIFIHPSLGYGIFTTLQKGMYIKARVQLVEIMESKDYQNKENVDSFVDLEILDLNKEFNFLEMINKKDLDALSNEEAVSSGFNMWQHYKKRGYYSLDQVVEWINQFKENKADPDIFSLEDQNLINRLHWNLYH